MYRPICLTACLFLISLLPVHAETHRVFLGEFDLAGPAPLPRIIELPRLSLDTATFRVMSGPDTMVGFIPGPFQKAIQRMASQGLHLRVEATHRYLLPRNGRYLRVALWADTPDLSLIEPLIYHIPIHTEEDLADYE